MKYGFIKVASATPKIRVADCKTNTINIIEQIKEAHKNGASLVVFPELCVTGLHLFRFVLSACFA